MAKKKQILFLPPDDLSPPENPVRPPSAIKEVDIFGDLDMIGELARRRAYGNGGKGNEMDSQGERLRILQLRVRMRLQFRRVPELPGRELPRPRGAQNRKRLVRQGESVGTEVRGNPQLAEGHPRRERQMCFRRGTIRKG